MATTLLVSEIFPPKVGGSGRWFWELYRRLPREQFVIAAGADPAQEEVDAAAPLRIHRLPLSFPTRFVRPRSLAPYRAALAALREVIAAERPRMIHCARCLPEGLLALALREGGPGVRYACFAHGEEVNLSNPEGRPRWYRRRVYGSRELGFLVGMVLRNASYVVANSDNTRAILTERWGLAPERVHRLYPGVDLERFSPTAPDPRLRAELGWSGRRVVLTVGRLQKRKGHDVLIRALPEIRRRVPELLYAVAGRGEEESALRALVARLGVEEQVRFLGEIADDRLVDCYRQCDLFALPNRAIDGDIEGFGMVLLEAQACGKPVLAGRSGGTTEALREGETGLLVGCEEPGELAAAVAELLVDPERLAAMGRAARRWVADRFDWQLLAAEAAELFSRPVEDP